MAEDLRAVKMEGFMPFGYFDKNLQEKLMNYERNYQTT